MTFQFYVGPINYQVHWHCGFEPTGVTPFYFRFFEKQGNSIWKTVDIEILEPLFELPSPGDCTELYQNWRTWKTETGQMVVQFWDGNINEYGLTVRVESDFSSASIQCLKSCPQVSHLNFLITSALRWLTLHWAMSEGGFLIHSALLKENAGKTLMGVGSSGAGKSTWSRFFLPYS